MTPHLRYLRYVVRHKLFVFLAGVQIAYVNHYGWRGLRALRFLWRLLVHDWSKFRPSEWRPYVATFYGEPAHELARRQWEADPANADDVAGRELLRIEATIKRDRQAAFNRAWLLHQHRNPHHWQHWVLREDSGATIVLLPPAMLADEMLADWIGAGAKIMEPGVSLAACIARTVAWYADNRGRIQLREPAQRRIEETLIALCDRYSIREQAYAVQAAKAARASIVIPGR